MGRLQSCEKFTAVSLGRRPLDQRSIAPRPRVARLQFHKRHDRRRHSRRQKPVPRLFGIPGGIQLSPARAGRLPMFCAESAKALPPTADFYADAKTIGPLASFDGGDSWVEHPYGNGIALIGDAASTSDPTFGQGMALTLRDARTLRDHLLRDSNWDRAGHRYAEDHDAYFRNCHAVTKWIRTVMQDQAPEACLIRARALPLIFEDATRVPDHLFSGPDLPTDDAVRARFFGEA